MDYSEKTYLVYRKLSAANELADVLFANMVFGQPTLIEALLSAIVLPTMEEAKASASRVECLNKEIKEQVMVDVAKADFKVKVFKEMYDELSEMRSAESKKGAIIKRALSEEELESLPKFSEGVAKCARTQIHMGDARIGLAILRVMLDVMEELKSSIGDRSNTMIYMRLPMENWCLSLAAHAKYDPGKNFWKRGETDEKD